MVESGKIVLALFLIGFWLFLPLPMMWLGVGGFEEINTDISIDNPEDSGIGFFEWIKPITQGLSVFFNLLIFNISGVSPIILRFINFLQLATVVFILIMLRGN